MHIKYLSSFLAVLATLPCKILASEPCLNSETFRIYTKNKDTGVKEPRSCHWIRFKEHRRQFHCQNPEVFQNCPQVCGSCCDDDPKYTFLTNHSERRVACVWLMKKQDKISQRRFDYCVRPEIFENDVNIRDACPYSCDFCFSLVTPVPTVSPRPSVSDAPTRSPTKTPTKTPTEPPTRTPTKNPTDNPTLNPTKNPTDNPTKNPTRRPTDNPTKNPSARPTGDPSPQPSRVPSSRPSISPDHWCRDDPSFKFNLEFNDFPVKCEWIGLSNVPKRRAKYCGRAAIKSACPYSCGHCECFDDQAYTFNLLKSGKSVKCEWISKNKKFLTLRRATYCYTDATTETGTKHADACPRACGYCED